MIFTSDEWDLIGEYSMLVPQSGLVDYLCRKAYIIDMSNQEMDNFIKGHLTKKVCPDGEKNEEPKMLFKIGLCPKVTGPYYYGYSRIRNITESEAVKWYKEYIPESYETKGHLFYKKDGEWVEYEEIN